MHNIIPWIKHLVANLTSSSQELWRSSLQCEDRGALFSLFDTQSVIISLNGIAMHQCCDRIYHVCLALVYTTVGLVSPLSHILNFAH